MNKKPIKLRPLTDAAKPYIVIRFIYTDGKEHEYYSAVNEMTGSRLSAFDNSPPDIDDDLKYVKSLVRRIKKECKVTEIISSKHFS